MKKKAKQRRCKTCGRPFTVEGRSDGFCSDLCRTTGLFLNGGGDTSKPSPYKKASHAIPRKARAAHNQGGAEKFPRVLQMLSLPPGERWSIAKTFTEEEQAYAARLAKRALMEEKRMSVECSWDDGEDAPELGRERGLAGGSIGDSDDGSI